MNEGEYVCQIKYLFRGLSVIIIVFLFLKYLYNLISHDFSYALKAYWLLSS